MGLFGRRSSSSSSTSRGGSTASDGSSMTSASGASSRVKPNSLSLGPSLDASPGLNSRRVTVSNGKDDADDGSASSEDPSDDDEDASSASESEEEKPKKKPTKSAGAASKKKEKPVEDEEDGAQAGYLGAAAGAVGGAAAAIGLTRSASQDKKNGASNGSARAPSDSEKADAKSNGSAKGSAKKKKKQPEPESESSESEMSSSSEEEKRPARKSPKKGGKKAAAAAAYDSPDDMSDSSSGSSVGREQGKNVATPGAAQGHGSHRPRKASKPMKNMTFDDVKLTEEELRSDISEVWQAMHLFMNSRMIEAEDICLRAADHRLYFSVGYTLIQCIKSLMTFEPEDLEAAVQCCKDSLIITCLLRKKDHSIGDRIGSMAKGTTSVGGIRSMTVVQRHAELVYAECLLLKAVIGIIYSGDFIAFLREALNMRSAYMIYRTLAKFVEEADKKAAGGEDKSIDNDFRSGVFLGNGLISVILSLLPSTVLKIMEVFGFTGDAEYGLRTLMSAGKWSFDPEKKKPGMKTSEEGIRRQICDMALLLHHLVISTYLPVNGVDINIADKVLHFNLKRYPEGIFFLYFSGRLYSTQTLGDRAIKQFQLAIQAQKEYIQLQHICLWDMALTFLSLAQFKKAYECFNVLDKESNWSKAIYAYAKATTLYETDENSRQANEIMRTVPDLMQRIAGKSIPLEKFVARKSRKFIQQNGRLVCPGIELAYVLNCLGLSPRFALYEEHLGEVSRQLAAMHKCKDPKQWGNGNEFWDDYCLLHLLRGIILRFIAHPEPHTAPRPSKSPIPVKEADEQAMISFNNVFKHGREIQHDHHVVWFAHFELGRVYAAMGEYDKAKQQYDLVMSGKGMEISNKKGKGKVSLQNQCVLRTNAAQDVMREQRAKSS